MTTDYAGIDYGMGQANVDTETGIRFGVVSQHSILQAWYDSAEADYGDPHCPKCGNDCKAWEDTLDSDLYSFAEYESADYACESCAYVFGSESAYGDEPIGYSLDNGEYRATDCLDSDVMILRSPYYTFAQFCSPCVPGAGNLNEPCPTGPRTYCFGPDWFDDEIEPCPYPVYRVADDSVVYEPTNG